MTAARPNRPPPCRFRAATPADAAWIANHLPADRDRGVSFVGERAGNPIAAFAVAPPLERHVPEGLSLAFHVEPTPDAAAIAANIVELAAKMAASQALGPLHAWPHPVEGSSAERAYRKLHFETFDRIVTWRSSAAEARAALRALADRMQHRADADDRDAMLTDLPLERANVETVLDLYESQLAKLGPMRDRMMSRLLGAAADAYHPRLSRVLVTAEGQVAAFVLATLVGDVCGIPARVVRPGYRDGAANLRMLLSGLDADPPPPTRVVEFETHDRHEQTLGIVRRLRAKAVQTRLKMKREL